MPYVTGQDLAKALGITGGAVSQQLKAGRFAGMTKKNGHRTVFDLDKCVTAYTGSPPRREEHPELEPYRPDLVQESSYHGQDLEESLAKEKFFKAQLLELDFQKKRGDLISVSEVREQYARELALVRTKVMGIAARVKQRCELDRKTAELIEDMCREALTELSESHG